MHIKSVIFFDFKQPAHGKYFTPFRKFLLYRAEKNSAIIFKD